MGKNLNSRDKTEILYKGKSSFDNELIKTAFLSFRIYLKFLLPLYAQDIFTKINN